MTKTGLSNARALQLFVLAALLLAACAAGDARFTMAEPAGFWTGLWHGLIACVTLIVGIFSDSVEVYERNNTGGWYDFGFLIGVGLFSGSGHSSHRAWQKGKDKTCEFPVPGKSGSASLKVDFDWTGEDDEDEYDDDDDEMWD
jgi:hypothetical protein